MTNHLSGCNDIGGWWPLEGGPEVPDYCDGLVAPTLKLKASGSG